MKNRTIFSSVLLAFLVGAFFFSVSTVFGAQLPSQNPPAGLVAPTFSGVNVSTGGNLVVDNLKPNTNKTLYVGGATGISGITLQSGTNSFSLITGGTFSLGAQIDVTGSKLEVLGNISTVGNIAATGNLNVNGAVSDGTAVDANPLVIDDKVNISGDTILSGKLNANNGVISTGSISSFLGVLGAIHTVYVEGAIEFTGASTAGYRKISGIKLLNAIKDSSLTLTTSNASGTAAQITLEPATKEIKVIGDIVSGGTGKPNFADGLSSGGDVAVTGHIKASDGIGSFSNTPSSWVTAVAGSTATVTASCPVGTYITGCGFYAWAGTEIYAAETTSSANTCTVRANNPTGNNKNFQAIARCFNPNN